MNILHKLKGVSRLKRVRSILGILLILLSIAVLFLWEWKGREIILMQEVLVAREEIQKGTVVNSSMFQIKGVLKDNVLHEALTPEKSNLFQGKIAAQLIPQIRSLWNISKTTGSD